MNEKLVFRALLFVLMTLSLGGQSFTQTQAKVIVFPRLAQAMGTPAPAKPPEMTYDPVYKNITEFQLGMALTNVSPTEEALVTLTAYAENGALLAGADITNPTALTLPPNGQIGRYASQLFGTGAQQKIAWVEASYDKGDLRGFYFVFNNTFDFLSGAPALQKEKASTRLLLPLLNAYRLKYPIPNYPSEEFRTEVDIVNPNSTAVKVSLTQWTGGSYNYRKWAVWQGTIQPRGKAQLDWLYASKQSGGDYLELTADQPILGSEIVFRNSSLEKFGVVDQTFSACVVTGVRAEDGELYKPIVNGFPKMVGRPHITIGNSWYTKLLFLGPSSTNFGVNYNFTDENGRVMVMLATPNNSSTWPSVSVYANEKKVVNASELLPTTSQFTGSAIYQSYSRERPPDKAPLYFEEFGPMVTVDGVAYESDDFRTLIPPIPYTTTAVFSHVAEGAFGANEFFGTGIAVRDDRPGEYWTVKTPNEVKLELYSSSGALLKSSTLTLPPGGKFAKTLPELFPGMGLPQFSGHVKVSGSLPFTSFGLYWVVKNNALTAVSMIPQQ